MSDISDRLRALVHEVETLESNFDELESSHFYNATVAYENHVLDDLLYSIGLGDWRTGYSVGEIDEIKKAICEVRGIYV